MTTWQPIETAPRDGTRLLMWDPPDYVVGWWALEVGTKWTTEGWKPRSPPEFEGWTSGKQENQGYYEFYEILPTHWQPLPAPPETTP